MAKKKKKQFPIELLIGVVAIIALIYFAWVFIAGIPDVDVPSEEVCDLLDNDFDGLVDEDFRVTCNDDVDCGPTGEFGEAYCKDGDVYIQGYESRCVGNVGTCLSECANRQVEILKEECSDGCLRGICVGSE